KPGSTGAAGPFGGVGGCVARHGSAFAAPPRNTSAAGADCAAGGAEVAAVLADHRVVAAFAAQRTLHDFGVAVAVRGFEDAHFTGGVAFLVEHAKHGVAMNHELRHVGHRAGVVLLATGAGHEGHE